MSSGSSRLKILVFGGSFDPLHRGHAALLTQAARRIEPRKILIVPAYQAPLKGFPGASAEDRLRMIRLGLLPSLPPRWRRLARIELGEMRSRRRVYTVETLKRLKTLHPGAELHFIVGSDSASSFRSWKEPAQLKALCQWWSAPRPAPGGSPKGPVPDALRKGVGGGGRLPSFFKCLPGPMPDISSTRVREALALGKSVSAWVAPAIAAYIENNGLYGRRLLNELKSSLSSERFEHTLAVARMAQSLAKRWGQDPSKARLAGLLHDCGRSVPVPRMASYALSRSLNVPGLSEIIRHQPLLLHAAISADLARRRYGVTDPEILNAIRHHTLGDLRMSAFDRLMYVADAVSEDRDYPGAAWARRLAFRDIAQAFRTCVLNKIRHALSRGSRLHPLTISLWNSLQE